MKIRSGFVSNSSSSSFVVTLVNFSDTPVTVKDFFEELKRTNHEWWNKTLESLRNHINEMIEDGYVLSECLETYEGIDREKGDMLWYAIVRSPDSELVIESRDVLVFSKFTDMSGEDYSTHDELSRIISDSYASNVRFSDNKYLLTTDHISNCSG